MGRSYRKSEKQKVINYIVEHKVYSRLSGIDMWKQMEHDLNIGRSYQSLKEHYKKVLVNELHQFGLTNEEIQSFRTRTYIPNIIPIVESSGQRVEENDETESNTVNNEIAIENNERSCGNNEVTFMLNEDKYLKIEQMLCLECMERELLARNIDEGYCVDCDLKFKITFSEDNQIEEICRYDL